MTRCQLTISALFDAVEPGSAISVTRRIPRSVADVDLGLQLGVALEVDGEV